MYAGFLTKKYSLFSLTTANIPSTYYTCGGGVPPSSAMGPSRSPGATLFLLSLVENFQAVHRSVVCLFPFFLRPRPGDGIAPQVRCAFEVYSSDRILLTHLQPTSSLFSSRLSAPESPPSLSLYWLPASLPRYCSFHSFSFRFSGVIPPTFVPLSTVLGLLALLLRLYYTNKSREKNVLGLSLHSGRAAVMRSYYGYRAYTRKHHWLCTHAKHKPQTSAFWMQHIFCPDRCTEPFQLFTHVHKFDINILNLLKNRA